MSYELTVKRLRFCRYRLSVYEKAVGTATGKTWCYFTRRILADRERRTTLINLLNNGR